MKTTTWWLATAAAALLAGCGGGDAVRIPAAADAVPDSANRSPQGLVAWMQALAKEDAETKEPLATARFAPPTPDDAEPLALR